MRYFEQKADIELATGLLSRFMERREAGFAFRHGVMRSGDILETGNVSIAGVEIDLPTQTLYYEGRFRYYGLLIPLEGPHLPASSAWIFSVMGKPLGGGTAVFIEPKVYVTLAENTMRVKVAEFRFERPIYAESGGVFLEYLRPETVYVKEGIADHDLELEVVVRRGAREATYSLRVQANNPYTIVVERLPLLIRFRAG